jgi:hypothetical protein
LVEHDTVDRALDEADLLLSAAQYIFPNSERARDPQ